MMITTAISRDDDNDCNSARGKWQLNFLGFNHKGDVGGTKRFFQHTDEYLVLQSDS